MRIITVNLNHLIKTLNYTDDILPNFVSRDFSFLAQGYFTLQRRYRNRKRLGCSQRVLEIHCK